MKRLIAVALAIILCAGCLIGVKTIIPRIQYNKGMTLMQQGEYDAAREIFISLGDFDDAVSRSDQALFEKAVDFATKGNAEQALPILETLRSDGLTALYREKADERISQIYLKRAEELVERQEYWAAVKYARHQLYDYYGTACHFCPAAHGDLMRIKSMSPDEILREASENRLI